MLFDWLRRFSKWADGDPWEQCRAPSPAQRLADYERRLGKMRAEEKAKQELELAERRAQEHIRREQQEKDRDAVLATRVRPATKAVPFPDLKPKVKLRVVGK